MSNPGKPEWGAKRRILRVRPEPSIGVIIVALLGWVDAVYHHDLNLSMQWLTIVVIGNVWYAVTRGRA